MPDGLRESGAIEVKEKLGTISGGDVLDVGTQDGDFIKVLMKLLREYKSFTGIDISEKDLNKAREQFKDDPVEFIVMDAESLTFKDAHFDTVCLSYTVHHLENIDSVFAEMYRVLKPGGNFIIQEMFSDGNQTAAQQVATDIHHLEAKTDTILGTPHFETLTRQRMRDVVYKLRMSEVEDYESSWGVKCLFCENAENCADPKNAENIESQIKTIDDALANVRDHSSYEELRKEGESLKERLKVEGTSEASIMYFFGTK